MEDEIRWSRVVSNLFYMTSKSDRRTNGAHVAASENQAFTCVQCNVSFSSCRALRLHMRAKHKVCNPIMRFLDDSGICPVCKNSYSTRWRCYKHIADTRRTKCSERLVEGEKAGPHEAPNKVEQVHMFANLGVQIFRELDHEDRKAGETQGDGAN